MKTQKQRKESGEVEFRTEEQGNDWFFQVPNVMDDFPLSVYAFRLYCHILRVVGANHDGHCFETIRGLSQRLGISTAVIVKAEKELEFWGLIKITQEKYHGEFFHNVITVRCGIWEVNGQWRSTITGLQKVDREKIIKNVFKIAKCAREAWWNFGTKYSGDIRIRNSPVDGKLPLRGFPNGVACIK